MRLGSISRVARALLPGVGLYITGSLPNIYLAVLFSSSLAGLHTAAFLSTDFLNPMEQFRQAKTLSDPVLEEDEDIELERRYDVNLFADRLDLVLWKIKDLVSPKFSLP